MSSVQPMSHPTLYDSLVIPLVYTQPQVPSKEDLTIISGDSNSTTTQLPGLESWMMMMMIGVDEDDDIFIQRPVFFIIISVL